GGGRVVGEDVVLVGVTGGGRSGWEDPVARPGDVRPTRTEPYPEPVDSIHDALVLGTRDYMNKCGFREAVVGLSGGIDSAVVAALAVEGGGAAGGTDGARRAPGTRSHRATGTPCP